MGTGKLLGKPNKLRGSDLQWTSIPSRGSRSTPSRFMPTESRISSGSYEPVWLIGFTFYSKFKPCLPNLLKAFNQFNSSLFNILVCYRVVILSQATTILLLNYA